MYMCFNLTMMPASTVGCSLGSCDARVLARMTTWYLLIISYLPYDLLVLGA